MLVLVMQIVTGVFLTMHFKPDELKAFASVEYIIRDVNLGWLIRYLHLKGASAFFIDIYLQMYRIILSKFVRFKNRCYFMFFWTDTNLNEGV
jgi:ubiquinol-cytochrome c reductase cytochrome b subunit